MLVTHEKSGIQQTHDRMRAIMDDDSLLALQRVRDTARRLHQRVLNDETNQAHTLGFTPNLSLLPIGENDNDPTEQLTEIAAILESLFEGRRELLQRMTQLNKKVSEANLSQAAPPPTVSNEQQLHLRIDSLIDTLDEPQVPLIETIEKQAITRQATLQKLIDKAFAQGQVIDELRQELERTRAEENSSLAAHLPTDHHTIDLHEFLVIHEDSHEGGSDEQQNYLHHDLPGAG